MSARSKHPIILAHGIARFDMLREWFTRQVQPTGFELSDGTHYFRGIKSHLEANGFEVHHASVSFAAGLQARATDLGAEVRRVLARSHAEKVHVIAHSMGGLDARCLIVDVPGMADRIASLTTIGTPHLGTSWADAALGFGGDYLVNAARQFINLDGFRDLSTAACQAFNERAQDHEATNSVRYQTFASTQERASTFLPLQPSWLVIQAREGANDGLVSANSQLWRPELVARDGTRKTIHQQRISFSADHLSQIGWWTPNLWKPADGLVNFREQIERYESGVREVYLGIARGLSDG